MKDEDFLCIGRGDRHNLAARRAWEQRDWTKKSVTISFRTIVDLLKLPRPLDVQLSEDGNGLTFSWTEKP